MIRLRKDDFQDPHELAKLAATAGLSNEEFQKEFEYLVANDPPAAPVEGRVRSSSDSAQASKCVSCLNSLNRAVTSSLRQAQQPIDAEVLHGK